MQVREQSVLDVLGAKGTVYRIPEYQRRYSWKERQCRELWLDTFRAGKAGADHYTGTILCESADHAEDGRQCVYVVDGQQRLTSVYLILEAFCDFLSARRPHAAGTEPGKAPDALPAPPAPETLAERFLQSLRPDKESPRYAGNRAFFLDLMQEEGFDPALLWRGIQHLTTIFIDMDEGEDPQPVFESLNSKGAKLTIADMVRNYLLSTETHDEQARLYDEYWVPTEGSFYPDPGSLRLDNMIKAWLTIRVRRVRARTPDDVYSAFKCYMEDDWTGTIEPVIAELRSFAMVWAENYRYHAVKKFKSMPWAMNGAATLTADYPLKPADDPEYAARFRRKLMETDESL